MSEQIEYFCTTKIWLETVSYKNAGLTGERIAELVRTIPDPGSSMLNLRCRDGHIVETSSMDQYDHAAIVRHIQWVLDAEIMRTRPMGVAP